jgi:LytS/YehU family sensor histidine kinase
MPEEMDHNNFDLIEDFIEPVSSFLYRHNLLNSIENKIIKFSDELYEIPNYISDKTQSDYVTKMRIKF